MPQTKQAKRLGAIERMESSIVRWNRKVTAEADKQLKETYQRKIATLERDIANTQAKVYA